MFFHDAIFRRLVSQLQPWLQHEPEIELKLGFINSELTAKNLKFDVSALSNSVLNETCRFRFKDVSIDLFSLRFSNWSSPAFNFEVRGLNITLLAGEGKEKGEGSFRTTRKSKDVVREEKKKAIARFDPEGSALHHVLESVLLTSPSRNWLKTSLLNLILKHCRLQIFDANLKVQFRSLNDALVWDLDLKEFNGESECIEHGCILRGVIGAVFKPLKEASFVMEFRDIGFGYDLRDQINCISSFKDLFACFKLNDLQVVDVSIRVPELSLSFSPLDLLVLSVLSESSSNKAEHVRSGRQLWKLAASRLGYVISSPILSLHNLVEFVCKWLRYLNAYENLLSLLGYSADNLLKKSVMKMSLDRMFLNSIRHYWEEISDIEKELPAEAISQARRIARYRAVLNFQNGENSEKESSVSDQFSVFSKVLSVSIFIWNVLYKILHLIVQCFILVILFFQQPKVDGRLRINSEDHSCRYSFLLNFGKILVAVSPSKVQNEDERIESNIELSYSDMQSFCFSIDMLLFAYIDEVFEQSLSISCGLLKGMPSTVESHSKNPVSSKVHRKGMVNRSEAVLLGEPAQFFLPSRTGETSAVDEAEGDCNPLLRTFLGEMWSAWQIASRKYDDCEIAYSETPWLFCVIKNCLTSPSLKKPDSGLWKCSLTVGKLNITLGYLSALSMAVLFGQIQRALNLNQDNGRAAVLSYLPSPFDNQLESSWEAKYDFHSNKMKSTFLRTLPEKCIELGVLIAGLHIQIALPKGVLNSGNKDMHRDDFHFGCDIRDIEVVVWPTSKSDLASMGWPESDGAEPECHRLREPQIVEIPKPVNEKYVSEGWVSHSSYLRFKGLNIYMRETAERQHRQILSLKPVVARSSLFRESVHMFSTTIIAISAAFSVTATGFTIISYIDELYVLFQVVAGLFSTVSHALGAFHLGGYVPLQDYMRQNMVFVEVENDEITAGGAPLIHNTTLVSTTGAFKFKSMDVILQNFRTDDKEGISTKTYDAIIRQRLVGHDLPDDGIWISVHQTYMELSFEELKLGVLCDLSGIKCVISRYQDHMLKSFNHSELRNLLTQSHSRLYEIFLSDFTLTFWLAQPHKSLNNSDDNSPSSGNTSYSVDGPHLITENETSSGQSSRVTQNMSFATHITASPPSHWILINVTLGRIVVAKGSFTNALVGANEFNKLTSLLAVRRNLQTISWDIKGGALITEIAALTVFHRCFSSYLHHIEHLLSIIRSSVKNIESVEYKAGETPCMTRQIKWEIPDASTIDISQFSLTLAVEDDSGGFQGLVIEVDVHMKLESANLLRKFIFNISHVSILSQVLGEYVENENQIPHFSCVTSNELSSHSVRGNQDLAFQLMDGSHRNKILNHLSASISAEKPENGPVLNQVWVGSGSVSGLDLTISLSEIQVISSMVSSLSSVSNKEATGDLKQSWYSNQEACSSLESMVPDGAIVAIQDLHQHMYFAVEGGENKYSLFGVLHYSLVGQKALFRVKHHKERIWKSSVLWFSLISLHTENSSGQSLRLNYRPGSCLVEISSTSDDGWSLWRIISHEPESHTADVKWEPSNKLLRNIFYLVNKRSDSSVAFVDGIPEFVRKPGHPFKFKVFPDIALASRSLPCIQIKIDNVALTVVHELLDTRDQFPLLRGCISNTELNLQLLSCKTRIMSKSIALLFYFDAQRNSWREFVHPVEICTFYRSTFQVQGSETVQLGSPVHFYCRSKELDISLTELSLDMILFVIGKLNVAGPFLVRSSKILANCCKVENQSGLSLLCHFYDKKSVTIARKQSASVFLRQPVSTNQPPKSGALVTIQLSDLGSFATSSLDVYILKTQALAWRTRIVSLQDSRTYPGPFVVVDISRKSEDGLSIVVSPLIRIYNETEFSMELRFQRPQQNEDMFASILLGKGDSVDDSMTAFTAVTLSGEVKKALMSLSVGNFLFSFRPQITDDLINSKSSLSAEWSDELEGGKAFRLSGIFEKLGYKVRKALSVESVKCSFSTACCTLKSGDAHTTVLHFLIQSIRRDVPIIQPDKSSDGSGNINSAVTLQEQKEIFLLPTVKVSNLLHSEIHVLLTEKDLRTTAGNDDIGKHATIPIGSTVDFYANPAILYFIVTLTAFNTSCRPVNSSDWVKKLRKSKNDVHYLDIDLEFGGGKYFASLRLSRGLRGILEASIFTQYSLKNDTDFSLILSPYQKPLSRDDIRNSSVSPDLGLFCPPYSTSSWFLKSHKTLLQLLKDSASEALLDLDALSGLTEISLEKEEGSGVKYITKFGVSTGPSFSNVMVPSQTVTMVPRHAVINESEETIIVRQYYLEMDDTTSLVQINSKQRAQLELQSGISKRKEFSLIENFIRKHRDDIDTSLLNIQFQLNDSESGCSGPVCIASLGRFFIKFRKQSHQLRALDKNVLEFAAVHVVEEGSTLVVHFHKPPNVNLPYRIENHLRNASLTFYQKDSSEREFLGSQSSAHYVWDNLMLPHKLVVLINDMHLLREIKLDKVRTWKPFLKSTQHRGAASHSLLGKKARGQKSYFDQLSSMEIANVGYEIYTEGTTRVLRICELSDCHKGDILSQSCAKLQLRVFHFAIHFLEHEKQDIGEAEDLSYMPLIVARFGDIRMDSLFTDQKKFNQISLQSLNVDQKWVGSPFASMLRRHQLDFSDSNASVLEFAFVLLPTSSNVRQVQFLSIVLQPIDLNLDEETLMRIASFWRTSISSSRTPSRQYYFDHFEVHPIKIIANFLPGDSYSSYNSAQETLRSLLHSVVKVPPIKNMVVELNGVLVTHALITMSELFLKCAQHYSLYAMRAIYIAKGSPLLPPAFASIFDDSASSSLDVFFDPSRRLTNLPGLTLGTFRFISKCVKGKGYSGTKRYFGDMEKTLRTVGSNMLFAAVTEISDSVLKGAESNGFDGMVSGFHLGILKLAMEPSLFGTALMGGGPDRKVVLDRSPGIDELYVEGYLQAMLDTMYRQEYLTVRVIDDQVLLKNLPPNSALIDEIMDRVKGFLVSKGFIKGDPSTSSHSLRHLQGESDWKIGPTVRTLCEHLFVGFAIRMLRKQTGKLMANVCWKKEPESDETKAIVPADRSEQEQKGMFIWKWGIGKFVLSGILAYVDGRLCRSIPNPLARRIVSGYVLSFLDKKDGE